MPGVAPPSSDPSFQTPLYMHGKQVIADGVRAFVGSENLTNTSLIQNRELGIEFTDAGMIARLQAAFTSDFTTPGNSLPARICTSGSQCVTVPCPPAAR
jgi:phosphatidylserine/phosphatidylglycerophosphate/cardiolipin synthase-like enzyme